MAVTGTTFNFNKTVTDEEKPSTAAAPSDGNKIDTKVAGEKKGSQNTKDFINLALVQQTLKSTVNTALQSVEGDSRMSQQVSAMQSITQTAISSVFMAATNPYALIASIAMQGISYGFKVDKFNRDKAWQNYDLAEYNARRGYSVHQSRTRNL